MDDGVAVAGGCSGEVEAAVNGQRPEGCSDVLVQGVASGRRAPQMR
ncbi:MAG: hypothetical protein SGI88_03405 [Candidatus Hydrogenedentes bacterium]|nr:hypothetical protein [Candidatus Hydrogenedentota bacterium]